MKKYLSIFYYSFKESVSNKNTIFFTIISGILRIFMYYFLWASVYKEKDLIGGLSWDETRTYIFLSFIINSIISFYTEVKISDDIKSGNIVIDFMRPISYQNIKFFETLGLIFLEGIISTIVIGIIAILIFNIILPSSLISMLWVIVSVACGLIIKFSLSYISGLLCFWTHGIVGIIWIRSALIDVMSGAIIPLSIYPEAINRFIMMLPFKNIVYTPVMIYLNKIDNLTNTVFIQFAWVIIFWVLSKLLFFQASKKLTVNGG